MLKSFLFPLFLLALGCSQVALGGQDLSPEATKRHLRFLLELAMKGEDIQELYTNRNFLDSAVAFESIYGKSIWSFKDMDHIDDVVAEYHPKVMDGMWLELAALVYDPCIWNVVHGQSSFALQSMAAKPEDLSDSVDGDCEEPGASSAQVKFTVRTANTPSWPKAAPDHKVRDDLPTNDEGDKLYSDHSKFADHDKYGHSDSNAEEEYSDYAEYEDDPERGDSHDYLAAAGDAEPYDPETDNVPPASLTIHILSKSPRVYVVPNFATVEETDGMIDLAEAWNGRSKHDFTGMSYEQPTTAKLPHRLSKRMEALLDLGNDMGQTLRMRHYEGGKDEYHPLHTDWFEIEHPDGESSNLIVTALLCLSTPEEGGATYFPNAKPKAFRVKPKRGMLVVWYSCTPEGTEDLNSEHMGELVVKGHKWTATNFFYQNAKAKCGKRQMLGTIK